jgi:hypothetical protein
MFWAFFLMFKVVVMVNRRRLKKVGGDLEV